MEKTVLVKETKPDIGTKGWSFELSDTENEKTTLAKSAPDEEDLVRWYLQDYPLEELFDRDKAQRAKAYLAKYSTRLYDSVFLAHIETYREINHLKILEHDAESSTFHALHWELLEQSRDALLGDQSPLRISRTVECPPAFSYSWKEDFVSLKSSKTFNILLFVSRPEILTHGKKDVSHRLAVRPLFSILESFPDGFLSIEVARPGTWEGLKQHLEDAAVRGKFFHLVHLDVHGSTSIFEKRRRTTKVTPRAKLHFLPDSFGAYGKVSAAQIARQLRRYKVLAVVLNACESARGDSGLQANLAKVFVAAGIPLVVAMSYKILDSAASIFMGQFYRSMFLERLPFTACAAEGRRALHKDKRRVGRFGITLDLVDWFVPVAYTSTNSEFEIEYLALVPSISDRFQPHLGIGQPEDVQSDIRSAWGERGPTSIEGDPVKQPTFEADIFRAETLLLTSGKKILLIEEDLGVGKENFLEQAASWWRESGLVGSTVHIRWQDQETPPWPENLLHGTELRLFGERMGITHKSTKSVPEFLETIAQFFLINAMLNERHPKSCRSTWIANMIILDGIPLHLWTGTNVVLNPIIPAFIHNLVNLETAVCVGSHADMRILASVLDDPPLMTLCGNSEQLFSKHGFQQLLQDPRQWHLLQSMLDWAWHIPAFEALVHRAISTFGLEDAYRLLAANVDLMSWSTTSKKDADRIAESLPGYRLARTVFDTLSAADQDRLLCFALFSNAAPIDPEKLIGIISQSKHHLHSPTQRAMRAVKAAWRKLSKSGKGGDAPCEEAGAETDSAKLLRFLATLGLVDHREFYVAFGWDSESGELSVSRAYARLHPGLSLFLYHGLLSRKLSRRRIKELAKGFLSYHGSRLRSLLANETPTPLREAAAAGDESARDLFQYNANREVEWGLWNFSAAMETWKESISCGANDLTYAQLFYNFFMEPQPLQYQFLDDPLVIATAVDVVLLLAPVHDRRLREWYKCERQLSLRALGGNIPGEDDPEIYRTMVTLPRAYWAVFDLIFACTNWLCCSFRQREDHVEFNCWVKVAALLLKAMEDLQDHRAEEMTLYRDAQDQFAQQDLPVQIEAAKRIVRLQLKWPNTGLEVDFSEPGSIGEIPELAPFVDFMRQIGAVARRERMWGFASAAGAQRALVVVNAQLGTIASAMADGVPKLFSKLPAEQLLKMRMQGWAPEDDGVPWPARDSAAGRGEDLDAEEIYNLAKREHLVTGLASSCSRALAKMRRDKCRWEDVQEECEASFERWYKIEWPQILLNSASHGQHGRMLNKLQVQALMAKMEWTGCLVYLDLVASDLEPPVDAAFWALCRATCLLELDRVNEAAKHVAKAFELCTSSSAIEMQSFFDLLHAMYRLLEGWPVNRDGASTLPSKVDILLFALKIGYHEYDSQQQIYAQNGTLFVLFLKLIDERLADISSVENNNELLDVQESLGASDEDFRRRVASFAPGAAFSEEELREGPDSFAEIIFEAQLVQNVIGDLNRSLRWLDSTILAHLSFGGSRFMKEGFVERVLHAKGISFPVPKPSLDEDHKASDDEADESSLEFRYTSPSTEDASVDEESNDRSTPGGRVIPKEIDIHSSYATEVLELLLQTKWRQKKIGAKTIMDMAKRRWVMPLDWRREHHVLSGAFLNNYARHFLMGVKNSDAPQVSRGELWKELEWDLMGYRLLGI